MWRVRSEPKPVRNRNSRPAELKSITTRSSQRSRKPTIDWTWPRSNSPSKQTKSPACSRAFKLSGYLRSVLGESLFDRLFRDITNDLLGHLATLEDQQRRNSAHVVALRSCDVLINVHFGNLHLALELARHFIYHGSQRSTRAAPCCPEIHHHRLL